MRIFVKPSKKEKYFPGNSVQHQPDYKLFVAHHNKQMTVTGRTTTIYRITDDTDDPEYAGSFYLLPDPYCESTGSESNYLQDFVSDEEEMLLYDQPIITNHAPHKI